MPLCRNENPPLWAVFHIELDIMHRPPEPEAKYGSVKCVFCGDSPVSHISSYINETLLILFHAAVSKIGLERIVRWIDPVTEFSARSFIKISRLFSLITISENPETIASLRSRLIFDEAVRRNIPIHHFFFMGKPVDWFEAYVRGRWHCFPSIPLPPELARDPFELIDDKYRLKQELAKARIAVPISFSATTISSAVNAFKKIAAPVIVKPRTGSRGRHTTVFITKEKELIEAFRCARKLNQFVLIEEYLTGSVCRATLVNGTLRGFLKGDSPYVIGNGTSSIQELIAEKNKTRHSRVAEVLIRPELTMFTRRQGYELDDVLPKGTVLPVLSRTGRLFGGSTREMCSEIHSKLVEKLEQAARVAGGTVIGFDVITPDPTKDPDTVHWGIIEGNSVPFIDLHDFALEGKPANVAQYIWDLWK